jgi:hypothetical protein
MKPHVSLAMLSALLLPLPVLSAQEQGTPPGHPITISLSYQGGTLADFVEQIRGKEPKANVIVAALAMQIRLPAIEMRGAGLDAVLQAACAAAEGPREIRVQEFRSVGEPVYSMLVESNGTNAEAEERVRRTTQVHSLNHLIDGHAVGVGFPPAVILSGLETAMEGTGEAPSIRFHKESGLLILRGNA